jgi:hypothetical protein
MIIKVKLILQQQIISIDIQETDTVGYTIKQICMLQGYTEDITRKPCLVKGTTKLQCEHTLLSYNTAENDTFFLFC